MFWIALALCVILGIVLCYFAEAIIKFVYKRAKKRSDKKTTEKKYKSNE